MSMMYVEHAAYPQVCLQEQSLVGSQLLAQVSMRKMEYLTQQRPPGVQQR